MGHEGSQDVRAKLRDPGAAGWRLWAVLAVVGIVVVFGAIWLVAGTGARPAFETEAVTRGNLEVIVTATGKLEPTNQVQVGSELSGLIEEVLVDYNDPVIAGQVLARLDREQLEAQVTQREATLQQAEARVLQAEATAQEVSARSDRVAALRRSNNASQQELDIVSAELKRASADIQVARAEVRVAGALLALERSRLSKAEIRSPINGVVLERLVEPGQTVAASFQTPQLFTLAEDLRRMELVVNIDEADIGMVREGQSGVFQVDAYSARTFDARIIELRNAPRVSQGVVTYEAILEVANDDLQLKPGMTVTARITVDATKDVLLLPNGALRFVPPGQTAVRIEPLGDGRRRGAVWVPGRDGRPHQVEVTLGRDDGRRSELLSGPLKQGDAVIVNMTGPGRRG